MPNQSTVRKFKYSSIKIYGAKVILLSLLVSFFAPVANSNGAPVVPADGTYNCLTGLASAVTPTFTITAGVVSNGSSCTGAVDIPYGVTQIGANAFFQAYDLTSIAIPGTVLSIGGYAFAYTQSLQSILIPASVTSISDTAFDMSSRLESIIVNEDNLNYSSLEGVLYDKNITALLKFPNYKDATSWSFPNSVVTIGIYSMNYLRGITNFTIPEGITSVGSYAFNVAGFTSISIPASVTSLGRDFLYNNTSLTTITVNASNPNYSSLDGVLFNKDKTTLIKFPNNKSTTPYTVPGTVDTLEGGAFLDLNNVISIVLPESLTTIGTYAFAYGNSRYITIPGLVTTIPVDAFWYNIGIASVTLPSGLTSLGGADTFSYTPALRRVCYTGSDAGVIASILAAGKVISCTPVIVPDAPVIGTATSTGATSAIVTFSAPADDGGTNITSYTAVATDVDTDETITQVRSGNSTEAFTFSFLTEGASYSFTISASNIIGASLESAASNVVPAPGSSVSTANSPLFTDASSYDYRFTVQVSNYDEAFTYAVTSSAGQASINAAGLVTVTGLRPDQSVTVTVTTTRAGYASGSGSIAGRAQVAPMIPTNKPTVTISDNLITCTIGSYSAAPTSSAFSLFVDGVHISTNFSALGDYLPDWIIPWATSSTITRTASLTSANWTMSDAYKGKAITCATLAYSKNATGLTASAPLTAR